MRDVHIRTMELAQQGFSHSGIAKRLDVTESTAKKYMDEVEQERGLDALL